MATQITKWRARDGREFDALEACQKHDVRVDECARVDAILPKINLDAGEYYQHDAEAFARFRSELWKLVLKYYGDSYPTWKTWEYASPTSGVGRVMSDCGGPVSSLWFRYGCINAELCREYQQPYYIKHPEEATTKMN